MSFLRKHYAAVIVGCCFLMAFCNMGLTSTSFNVYQSSLVALPGVGNVGGSLVVTVRVAATFAATFFAHRYYGALSLRLGVLLASLCTVVGYVIFGLSDHLVGLCIGAVFTGTAYGLGGMVAATLLIGHWFKGRQGTALGWASVGSGIASAVVPLVVVAVIHATSLTTAFFIEAACALGLTIIIVALVRPTPESMGLRPVGDEAASESADDPTSKGEQSAPAKSVVHETTLRPLTPLSHGLMLIALVLLGGVAMTGMAYLGILMTSVGIDPGPMALLLSISGIAMTVGKLVAGIVCDRIGTLSGSAIFFALLVVGLGMDCLVGVGGFPCAVIGALCTGAGLAICSTGISLWSLELSDEAHRLKTVRNFQTAFTFGGFVFNMMPGPLRELTGTYLASYVVLAVMALSSAIVILTIYRRYSTR